MNVNEEQESVMEEEPYNRNELLLKEYLVGGSYVEACALLEDIFKDASFAIAPKIMKPIAAQLELLTRRLKDESASRLANEANETNENSSLLELSVLFLNALDMITQYEFSLRATLRKQNDKFGEARELLKEELGKLNEDLKERASIEFSQEHPFYQAHLGTVKAVIASYTRCTAISEKFKALQDVAAEETESKKAEAVKLFFLELTSPLEEIMKLVSRKLTPFFPFALGNEWMVEDSGAEGELRDLVEGFVSYVQGLRLHNFLVPSWDAGDTEPLSENGSALFYYNDSDPNQPAAPAAGTSPNNS